MTMYMDHLHYELFEQPVLFRLQGATKNALMPVYDIEGMLCERHGLVERETMDVAQSVAEPIAEFAFDASVVDDAEAVIEDVQTLLDNYNELPEGLDAEEEEEYRKHDTIIADINKTGASSV